MNQHPAHPSAEQEALRRYPDQFDSIDDQSEADANLRAGIAREAFEAGAEWSRRQTIEDGRRGQPSPDYLAGALRDVAAWCESERHAIGAVDGYDYRSGEEYGLRCAQIELEKRAATLDALPLAPGGNTKPRPADCGNPMRFGWHKAYTRPDVNLWLCNEPSCLNGIKAQPCGDTKSDGSAVRDCSTSSRRINSEPVPGPSQPASDKSAGTAQPVAYPAAWMVREKAANWDFCRVKRAADDLKAKGWEVVPLYTAPPVPDREAMAKLQSWIEFLGPEPGSVAVNGASLSSDLRAILALLEAR